MQGQALQESFVPNNFIIVFMWGIIADYMFLAVGKYGCVFELAGFAKKIASLVQSANTSFDALLDALLSSSKPSPIIK